MNSDNAIMLKVMKARLKQAKVDVTKAKKQLDRTELKMQIALDARNEADEYLLNAKYELSLVERDQENWIRRHA